MLDTSRRTCFTEDHQLFREQVRKFFERELTPHLERWEKAEIVDRTFWNKCGEAGLLCPTVPEEYGGLGLDFGYNAVIDEELAYAGSTAGITLHSDIVADYIVAYGSEEQKRHWLPRMISAETPTAIAMTEPGAGSDLQGVRTSAVRDGADYVINGSKTYITNGQHSELTIVVAKTTPLWARGEPR
jgi:alkylation response protein AidB-like acyl-CoA dehydrogenase